ncbi:diguanylate cyclase [Clostridioides difficile]|nr:diguanylate cyclase [Clostridioides difficile]EGT4666444.1 diguanylate cyclase [Clostridioides difficile]
MNMKKEALEVLKNRRSIRKFKSNQVSKEELDLVLEAGTYAPTSKGSQEPIIIAVQDEDTVSQLDALNARILNIEKTPHPYYGAPTILLILAPEDALIPVENCSLVAGNLMNAAYAVGLGSCWIHRAKEMFESIEGKELLKKWGLPETLKGVASIALGYSDCPHPKAASRKEGYILRV